MFREKITGSIYVGSFDEFFLLPGLSRIEPNEVSLRTRFSSSIELEIPIASSPMDTVSGYDMAVAMALLGGIGVVHRNMPVEEQIEIVKRVKETPPVRTRPLYVSPRDPCGYVLSVLKRNEIREIPVVEDGMVRGLVYYHDLREACRDKDPVEKIVRPPRTLSLDLLREVEKVLMREGLDVVPLVDSVGRYMGTVLYRDLFQDYTPVLDDSGRLVVAAAISPFDPERAARLDNYVDALVTDVAHFHNKNVIEATRELSRRVSKDLVVGNIALYDAVRDIVSSIEKVDGLRVGLGGGSICTTPEVSGVYVPTLYAVASVRDAVDELGLRTPVIADGGIRSSADIVRALAAGASTVMLGNLLAGTEEASAPKITVGDRVYKPYRGMASRSAMETRFAVDRYSRAVKNVAEGIEGLVPYRGSVYNVVRELIEGVRAGMGYVGASSIEELWRLSRFIRVRPRTHRDIVTGL